jgi:hypothetical protein
VSALRSLEDLPSPALADGFARLAGEPTFDELLRGDGLSFGPQGHRPARPWPLRWVAWVRGGEPRRAATRTR